MWVRLFVCLIVLLQMPEVKHALYVPRVQKHGACGGGGGGGGGGGCGKVWLWQVVTVVVCGCGGVWPW